MNSDLLEKLVEEHARAATTMPSQGRLGLIAVLIGIALSLSLLVLIGLRQDLNTASSTAVFWIKLGLPASLSILIGRAWWLSLSAGFQFKTLCLGGVAALAAYWLIAVSTVLLTRSSTLAVDLWGRTSMECLAYIAVLSTPLCIAFFGVARRYGVLNARASGLLSGALAGLIAATLYSVHCREPGLLFLGTWYMLGAAIPAVAGALLGPRLLTWKH
jgi:hypothetical protein